VRREDRGLGKTAIIFPGQGAQAVGMGRDVSESCPKACAIFDRANDVLGMDLKSICFDGPIDRLNTTALSQPAIFVTSVAIWRALEASGRAEALSAEAMAGLSLGEYTALHVCGAVDFDDCLRLVAERGRLMQRAAEARPGSMVSIMGLDEAAVRRLCDEAGCGEELVAANFNCPGQVVLSGTRSACDRAAGLAERFEARALVLNVAGAFHSRLMEDAAEGLETALASVPFRPGFCGVVSNVSADYHGDDPEAIRALLRAQLVQPVRWQASIERLISGGFDRFVEVGPGRVLTGLMRKIDRSARAINFSTASGLSQTVA